MNKDENKIKIFGETFVENNKKKCYILSGGIKYNLNTYFNIKNNKSKRLEVELVGINNITNKKECLEDVNHKNV